MVRTSHRCGPIGEITGLGIGRQPTRTNGINDSVKYGRFSHPRAPATGGPGSPAFDPPHPSRAVSRAASRPDARLSTLPPTRSAAAGVERHRLGRRRVFSALEDRAQPPGILGDVAAAQGSGIVDADSEIGRVERPGLRHDAVPNLDHRRRRRHRELVEAVVGVEHHGVFSAELGEGRCHQGLHLGSPHAEHLATDTGRVGERSEQIEDRPHPESLADRAPPRPWPGGAAGRRERRSRPRRASSVRASRSRSSRTPSASRTSADPHRDETDRLPCLATGTPPAAATRAAAVEMLIVSAPSPPVPQVSMAPAGAATRRARARMARAAAATSVPDSPLARSATSMAGDLSGLESSHP